MSRSASSRANRRGEPPPSPEPLPSGSPLSPPTPIFTKLDDSVVAEELARLEGGGSSA